MGSESDTWTLGDHEVTISRPERVYWPEPGLTKLDLLRYYETMAPVMLPYFKDRPATLRVCPRGPGGPCFYRRDQPKTAPDWLRGIEYRPETTGEPIQLPLIDDAAGLIWYANMGTIEFHLWSTTAPELETPDQVVFDLDPGEDTSFSEVLRTAAIARDQLAALGLNGYAKTSGGSGMHVYIPIARGQPFDDVRAWVKRFAELLEEAHPDLIEVARGATHRGERVTIDYAQNSIGRNTAAPYTARLGPGARVSAPVSWDEVEAGKLRPDDFTIKTMPDRVNKLGDLFKGVLNGTQQLPEL